MEPDTIVHASSWTDLVILILTGSPTSPRSWILQLLFLPLALVVILLVRRLRKYEKYSKVIRYYNVGGHLYVASAIFLFAPTSAFVTWDLVQRENNSAVDVTATVIATVIYWSALFHLLAFILGPALTHLFGRNWVRCIDYVYLLGSTVGILRVAVGSSVNTTTMSGVSAAGVVLLGISLSLRLTKTTIEIFEWDKLSPFEKLSRGADIRPPPKS